MDSCENIRARVAFYLDDELGGRELAEFELHLDKCSLCRHAVETERQFVETVRQARPLYTAPPELRERAQSILSKVPSAITAPPELRDRIEQLVGSSIKLRPLRWRRALAFAAVIVVAAAGIWHLRGRQTVQAPSDFARMAVDTHQRHQRGQLPLEITSDSPEAISGWFHGKVPFSLELPNYQEHSGQEKLYRLEGARLVGYKNDYAAYVAYEMQKRPISLVVTSDGVATPSGGETVVSKGLTFHYETIDGLKAITWSDRGLTYALVSDLEERGQQSCIVCHAGTRDRDFIESLRPQN